MSSFVQDLRFGLRTLARSPGVTLVATLSLALGIGVNTSMFSVVNAALLKPFPYETPEELVAIWGRFLPSSGYDFPYFAISDPEALDLMRETGALSGVAPYRWRQVALGGLEGEPERAWALEVPAEWFSVLGVAPAMGAAFEASDSRGRRPCTTVVGHQTWIDRLDASRAIGGTIHVDGEDCTVLGVMPESFFFLDRSVRLFLPLTLDPRPEQRESHSLGAVGRLAPGVSLERARAEMNVIMDRWVRSYPDHHAKGHFLVLEAFHADRVRNVRPALVVLMSAVGLVLLIVCSNVASLLLGRAESRHHEIALRISLGARRSRLVRQLLTESVLLAGLGGGLGLLVSSWTLDAVVALYPESLPGAGEAQVDGTVLLFALALSLGTVLLFGLLPAIFTTAPRRESLAGDRASSAPRRRVTLHGALVVAQIGLSLTLLVGAGLLLKSFSRLREVDLGFDPGSVLVLPLNASSRSYPDAGAVRRLYADLLERVRSLPEVENAALISSIPLGSGAPPDDFLIENRAEPAPGETAYNGDYLMVSPELFETLRIPLRRGRGLSSSDDDAAPPVAVLNETAVRMYWPGEDPLGRRIRYHAEDSPWITIVGIVGDVRSTRLDQEPRPAVYAPIDQSSRGPTYDQTSNLRSVAFVVRARREPEDLIPSLRAVLRQRDASLPVSTAMSLTAVVSRAAAEPRFTSLLMGSFAGTALLLALLGVYGIVSFSVEQMRRGIGIRIALGATPFDVLRLVLGQGVGLGFAGVGFGLASSLLLSRALEGLLYQVDPFDSATFLTLTALLVSVVLLASYVPARRAARVNVIETLRQD